MTQNKTPLNFSTFIMGMAHATLVQLGVVEDPLYKKTEKNLEAARQQIDILAVLQEKTKGNLSEEENALMTNLLADLRTRYLSISKS